MMSRTVFFRTQYDRWNAEHRTEFVVSAREPKIADDYNASNGPKRNDKESVHCMEKLQCNNITSIVSVD
jgi:hypothetical protein